MNQRYALHVYFLMVVIIVLSYLFSPSLLFTSSFIHHSVHLFSLQYKKYSIISNQTKHTRILACTSTEPTTATNLDDQQLSQELMAVFGHDSLWQRAQTTPMVKQLGQHKKNAVITKIPTPNSLTASWETISAWLPFNNDLNLGSNSDQDVYVQFLAKKKWALHSSLYLNTEQIFRYGSSSKNYAETHLNLTQQVHQKTFLSTQFNFSKTQDEEYAWSNRTFQRLQWLSSNNITYGIVSTGNYENKELRINEWGPYFSWKRPIWRNWLFMQNDLNYTNVASAPQDSHFNYQMIFEAHF